MIKLCLWTIFLAIVSSSMVVTGCNGSGDNSKHNQSGQSQQQNEPDDESN